MDAIKKLKRRVALAALDETRARTIENLADEFGHVQQWLELELRRRPGAVADDLLWIECARRFSLVAEQALGELTECHDELATVREKAKAERETVG
jgi:hypothetical protein